jgi:hypothetical protein
MMEKEAGRAVSLFYLCTMLYDGEGSRKALSLFYLCTMLYDGEGSRKSSLSLSVLSVYGQCLGKGGTKQAVQMMVMRSPEPSICG